MSQPDELTVTVGGRDVGLEAVLKKVDAEMQQSADRAVRLGQQYARLAQAQGSPTAAANILAGTMQRAGAASEQSLIGISTQSARLATSSQGLQASIAGLGGQLSGLGGTAGQLAGSIGNLAGSFGTLGGVGAAIGLGKIAVDLSVAGANADLLRERFDSLAVSAGTTGDALITALRAASGGEISDLNLTLAANKAQLLGVADSAEEFGVLMGIARDRAQQMGISTTQAFNDLTTGLGRGSALILDNLGIIVSVKEANEQYAASLGKTASALTEAEQKQALINQVLAQGRASFDATGGAVQSTAGTFARLGASSENARNSIGSFLSQGLTPIAAQATQTTDALGGLFNGINSFLGGLSQLGAAAVDDTAALAAFDAEMQRSGDTAQAEAAYQTALAQATASVVPPTVAATAAIIQGGGAYNAYAQAANAGGIAAQAAAAQIQFSAQAMQQSAEASVLAAAQHQAQTAATAALAQETNAAAQAFLNLNPGIDAAGIAAAIAAGRVPPLVGQLAALMQQANATAGAMAQLAAQQAGVKGISALFNAGAGAAVNFQGATAGAFGGLAGGAPRDLSGAIKFPKPPKPPRGGSGGTRLSDQQKLQNSLLASQEQYEQKSEDAAAQHAADVVKINQDFYAKMREAQRDFDQSQLEGRAGFYDSLGQIENQKIAQAASAAYEAASVEAGRIAQEQGADVAEKYMQAQEQIISARAKRLAEIEKAEKDKDTGRAEYLRGVDQQYKAAEDARLARIQEGEGSIASERQKQLDEAAAKENEAQEKIGLAADRAADKKIAASDRAGQAIDTEMAKAAALAATYDRVGQSGSRAGITPAAGAPATPSATPTVAPAAPAGEDPALAALDSIRAAVDAAAAAIVSATRDTTGAVRSLKNTGNIAG